MQRKSDIYLECRSWLPEDIRQRAAEMMDRLTEIRLRSGGPARLVFNGGDVLLRKTDRGEFSRMVAAMLGHSLYARQSELARGYFTLRDGSRVGVCGDFSAGGPRSVADIGSVSIRIAREVKGCAADIIDDVRKAAGTLVVSPPGMGKTTLIRDITRLLSEGGLQVCIIDERDEIAACRNGEPAFDLGPRTDVICGADKQTAMMTAVRSAAPDVLIADEIGLAGDAEAIRDALRCGVKTIVSAHGDSLDRERMRPAIAGLVGDIDMGVLLGTEPGRITQIRKFDRGESDV